MKKQIDIGDVLVSNRNKLIINDGIISSTIIDQDLDAYECTFLGGNDVEICTEGYTHITLDIEDLENLIQLILVAEEKYKKIENVPEKTLVIDFMVNWGTNMSKRLHTCLMKYFKDAFIEDITPKEWNKYRGCGVSTWLEFEDYREAYLRIKDN